jgi:hypothetical protein
LSAPFEPIEQPGLALLDALASGGGREGLPGSTDAAGLPMRVFSKADASFFDQ